jgi:hypothetical protein
MTRRQGEITRADIRRASPRRPACRQGAWVQERRNRTQLCEKLSVAPIAAPCGVMTATLWYSASPSQEDAQAFPHRFNGERLPEGWR